MRLFNESGRSMMEMLGVLAVISILSVAGVYGYGIAMRKYRANELIREVNFRANQVATQLLLGTQPQDVKDLESAFLSEGKYTFSASKDSSNPDRFKIDLVGTVSEGVCRQLYSELGSNNVIRAIGQENVFNSVDDCAGGKNSLSFFFNNNMSKEGSNSNYPTLGSKCSTEGEGVCEDNGVIIRKCVRDGNDLRWTNRSCEYGCENGQCRTNNCTDGEQKCLTTSGIMKCVNNEWQKSVCNWGCEDGACVESCTTETNIRRWTFYNGRYCMFSTCQNGTWDNPIAFCEELSECSTATCKTINSDALAEFRSMYLSNQ